MVVHCPVIYLVAVMSNKVLRDCPQTVFFGAVLLSLFLGGNTVFVQRRGLEDGPDYAEIAENLSAAIVTIVQSSFVRHGRVLPYNMYAYVQRPERRYLFGDIMEKVLKSSGNGNTVRIGLGAPVPGDHERHYNVLLVDSAASLKSLYAEFAKYHLYTNGYFVIVLHTHDSAHYYDVLFEIFELNWFLGIINANVLVYALSNLSLLYNIHPFNEFHCKGLAPTISNRFTNLQWWHTNFFPDKLADLHGCALICATWEEMPYRSLNERSGELGGIEGKLMEYLADSLNFTLQFHLLNHYENSQILEKKGLVLKELFANGTDFVVGDFPYKTPVKEDAFTPTFPYFLSNFYYIVNSNLEPYSPFTKLFLPFSSHIWALLLFIYLGVLALRLIVSLMGVRLNNFIFGATNHMPGVNMLNICLGGALPSPQVPQRSFARYVLALWLIMTMLLRSSYQAFLYNLIKSNIGRPPPKTIAELLHQDYQLLMTEDVLATVYDLLVISSSAQILNMSRFESFELVRRPDRRIAILTPYEFVGYFKRFNASFTKGVHVVEERVLTQQLSFYMASNSMLLQRFNRIILRYITVGLWAKWDRELLDLSPRSDSGYEEPIEKVTMQQMYGAWYVWLVGNVLSAFVLLIERLWKWE